MDRKHRLVNSRTVLVAVFLIWMAAPGGALFAGPHPIQIESAQGLVSIRAEDARVDEVLLLLSRKLDRTIQVHGEMSPAAISCEIKKVSPTEALQRIFPTWDSILLSRDGKIEIWLAQEESHSAEGGGPARGESQVPGPAADSAEDLPASDEIVTSVENPGDTGTFQDSEEIVEDMPVEDDDSEGQASADRSVRKKKRGVLKF